MSHRKHKQKPHKRTKTLKCTSCGSVRESDGNEIYHAAGARCRRCGSRMDLMHYRHVGKPQSIQQAPGPVRLAKLVIERNSLEQAGYDELLRLERLFCLPGGGLYESEVRCPDSTIDRWRDDANR